MYHRQMKRGLLCGGAAICFMLSALLLVSAGLPESTVLQPDVAAPDFTLSTLKGETLSLDALRGSPVIVNFWATWCVPCRIEMPALQSLYDDYADSGLHVLAINLGEPRAAVVQWAESFELTFDILLDPDGGTAVSYGMRAPPATFVIAPDGRIVRVFYGPVTAGQLRAALAVFLV